jgi:hypothetical protein
VAPTAQKIVRSSTWAVTRTCAIRLPRASVSASTSMTSPTWAWATNWVTTQSASRWVAASMARTDAATPVPP